VRPIRCLTRRVRGLKRHVSQPGTEPADGSGYVGSATM
jgi:hypothetical protein